MKSKVLLCTRRKHVELQEKEIFDPASDEVQIRVDTTLISPGTERAFILNLENTFDEKLDEVYPMEVGYCTAGVIEKVGKEVKQFKVGDRVAGKPFGHKSIGNASESWITHIPDGVSFESAAFLSMGAISLQGIRKARIEIGEEVMVLGLGLIGQLAMQLARISGAASVVGVDRVDTRLKMSLDCGGDSAIDASKPDWQETLKNHSDGKGPHVVIESTGFPDAIPSAIQSARRHGRIVLLGSTRGESTINFYRDVHKKGITIHGAHAGAVPINESYPGYWTWQEDAECFMKLLQKGQICLEPLITERIQWENIEETYEQMLSWNTSMMGTIIKWK